MAITISFAVTTPGPLLSDSVIQGVVTVTNAGANTISIQNVVLSEQSTMGCNMRQPDFLVPNAAPGTYPTIASAASASYPFAVVCAVPNMSGASPIAPNAYHGPVASPPSNVVLRLGVFVQAYDATAGAFVNNTASLQFPVGTAVAMFPVPTGGALQSNYPGDTANFLFSFL